MALQRDVLDSKKNDFDAKGWVILKNNVPIPIGIFLKFQVKVQSFLLR